MTGYDIRRRRLAVGLTQEALAALIGVRAGTVWRWEMGRSIPHRVIYRVLEKTLKTAEAAARKEG